MGGLLPIGGSGRRGVEAVDLVEGPEFDRYPGAGPVDDQALQQAHHFFGQDVVIGAADPARSGFDPCPPADRVPRIGIADRSTQTKPGHVLSRQVQPARSLNLMNGDEPLNDIFVPPEVFMPLDQTPSDDCVFEARNDIVFVGAKQQIFFSALQYNCIIELYFSSYLIKSIYILDCLIVKRARRIKQSFVAQSDMLESVKHS